MAFRLIYVAAAIIGGIIETSPVAPNIVLDGARDAEFLYDSTGTLIASIAPAAGTDSHGNHFVSGFATYNTTTQTFAQLISNALNLGVVNSGVPDTAEAGSLVSLDALQGQGILALTSGTNTAAGLNDATALFVEPGMGGATSGVLAPFVQLNDTLGTSPVDLLQSGTAIKTSNTGVVEQWLVPVGAASFTIGSLQYRLNTADEVRWIGSCQYTGANVAGAGAATVNVNVGPSHRPKAQWKVPVVHYTSTGVQKNVAASAIFNTDGTVVIQWGDGMAGTTHDVNGVATNDVFWIEANVPMGNIP